jgi:pimeloyl-ACP methyl ester carboxylesterase
MREKAIRFGRGSSLVGILSESADPDAKTRPGIVLVNSGILHRVGACRLHVILARALARDGYNVLRFDFSGIGDSPVRRDDLPFEESAVVELQDAMNHLSSAKGHSEFVVMGLCSGADMALETAKVDARIVGLGLLDPWAYRTPRYYLKRIGPKLLSPAAWANAIRVRIGGDDTAGEFPTIANGAAEEELDLPTYVREFPPRAEAERDLRALNDRGVQLCCVFTGGQQDHYNHAGQFRAAFKGIDFGDSLRESYIPEADHIFTVLEHQRRLVEGLRVWMGDHWPGAAAADGERVQGAA